MEMILTDGFCELSLDEMNLVEGGGWREFGYAMGGTLLIAGAPIVAVAPGGGWIAAGTMLGGGIAMIGNC